MNKTIVAYDANTKRVIGNFELNELVDIKVIVDFGRQKYDVYINGEVAAQGFSFRNRVSDIKYLMFGSSSLDALLQYEYLKAYVETGGRK